MVAEESLTTARTVAVAVAIVSCNDFNWETAAAAQIARISSSSSITYTKSDVIQGCMMIYKCNLRG
jgi:hypothetical protein